MVSIYHKAIICVAELTETIEPLEQLLNMRFAREYVIEIAENSQEVLNIIQTLHGIGVTTSVVVTDEKIDDMHGLELADKILMKYPNIKVMLLTESMDIDYAQKLVNQNKIYGLIKKPWDNDQLLHMVSDACHQFESEEKLEGLMRKLRLSEQEKNLILQSISEAIIYVDTNHNIKWKNDVAENILKSWKAIGHCFEEMFGLEDSCENSPMKSVMQTKEPMSLEQKFSDGSYKLVRYFPVLDHGDILKGVVITLLDISDRKLAENMTESLLEMSRFINMTDSVVDMYNRAYSYIKTYFSLKFMCIAGEDYDTSYVEFLGDNEQQMSKEQITTILKSLRSIITKNRLDDFVMMENTMGTIIAYPMGKKIIMMIIDETLRDNDNALKFINTIAEQIKTGLIKIENLKKITYQAKHDTGTGLYNREYFVDELSKRLDNRRIMSNTAVNFSVALIDLNYFKDVNDNFSHIVGDEVLLEIANRLQNAVRNGDVVARIGGDEFAVLFVNHSRREIIKMIKRLQREISKAIQIRDFYVEVGSSIGIVYDIHRYKDIGILLRDADKAMYEAKKDKSGIGNYVFFEKNIQEKVVRQQQIEKALKSDDINDELSLIFQPIVQLRDMRVKGYEGFLRWETKDGKRFAPDEFIPIANEGDDILAIGRKVIDLALDAVNEMNDNGCEDCFINVNMTAKQLMNRGHMAHVKKSIVERGINSHRLRFDVAEGFKESQIGDLSKNIHELRDFGVHVNLDDFGTGASSLNMLNTMDVQEIKIDATYIQKIRFNDKALRMVKSIISLAKSLGIEVTAEGVEKKEDLEMLISLGCDNAQGYYFSRPKPLNKVMSSQRVFKSE